MELKALNHIRDGRTGKVELKALNHLVIAGFNTRRIPGQKRGWDGNHRGPNKITRLIQRVGGVQMDGQGIPIGPGLCRAAGVDGARSG